LLLVEGNGSLAHIGRVALWDLDLPGARHQNHLIRIRPVIGHSQFLLEWLASPLGRDAIIREATSAAGLYTLSISKVERLPAPLAPEEEQAEIARRLKTLLAPADQIASLHGEAVEALDSAGQSILAKAFRGELVEQDPNDEPAEALLARLRAEKSAAAKDAPPRSTKTRRRLSRHREAT
jgi:type I restriction enzyme S subunit